MTWFFVIVLLVGADVFLAAVAEEVVKALDEAWLTVKPYAAPYYH